MRFAFVGDIALGDHPKAVGFGFRSRYPLGIPPAMAGRIDPPGPRPDFLFGNLEFALGFEGDGALPAAALECRGLNAYAAFLASAGITALNVANNHSSQAGAGAFRGTVDVLRAAGIHVVGTPSDFTDAGVVRVGGRRVALLGWSDRPRQYGAAVPPYNEFSDAAYDQIERARQRADTVIASIHWGHEFILVPEERERQIGRTMIEAGATCVIGHHPHVVRELERYRDGLIAYSLGNFIGDMTWDPRTRVTAWLTAELEGDRVVSSALVPTVIADDYFPERPSASSTGGAYGRLATASRRHGERVTRVGYAQVAEAERRRHALLTAWMMLRNAHRYPSGIATDVFRRAIGHRIQALLARP